jgi:hypothetical protein
MNERVDMLMRFVPLTPPCLVWVVGFVVAFLRWKKHPQVSLLTCFGLGFLLAMSLGVMLFYALILPIPTVNPWLTIGPGLLYGMKFETVILILHWTQSAVQTVAWAFILVALFRWRQLPIRRVGYDGQYLPPDFSPTGVSSET